jgi:hypothetical protein
MEGNMELCGVPIDVNLFVVRGNLNEVAEDPYSGEWSLPEYKNTEINISEDFLDYLDNNFIITGGGEENEE